MVGASHHRCIYSFNNLLSLTKKSYLNSSLTHLHSILCRPKIARHARKISHVSVILQWRLIPTALMPAHNMEEEQTPRAAQATLTLILSPWTPYHPPYPQTSIFFFLTLDTHHPPYPQTNIFFFTFLPLSSALTNAH